MLARLVAAENLLLTIAAIPLGLVVGYQLGSLFIATYEIHGQLWTINVRPLTLVLTAVAVLVAALLAQLPSPGRCGASTSPASCANDHW